MASNFKISCNNDSASMTLKLSGDFDGTSACELINVLKNRSGYISKIFIQTEGLKTIYPFGLDIFRKSLKVMECPSPEIKVTGNENFMLSLKEHRKCS